MHMHVSLFGCSEKSTKIFFYIYTQKPLKREFSVPCFDTEWIIKRKNKNKIQSAINLVSSFNSRLHSFITIQRMLELRTNVCSIKMHGQQSTHIAASDIRLHACEL